MTAMKTFQEIQKILQTNRKELAETYGVLEIGIFGSCLRGEQKSGSDIDILVEIKRPAGFVRFMRLEQHLKQLLGAKVDLVSKKALKPFIGRHILEEVRYV